MPDTVQEWDAEGVIFEAFGRILQAFWPPKLAKSGLKDAPQRRAYARSLEKGPPDATGALEHPWAGPFFALFEAFLGPNPARSGLKHAPQRRVYPRSLAKGPSMAGHWLGRPGVPFFALFGAFWGPNPARSGLKHAPQRRVYPRSLAKGPIDGTHGCAQKTVFSVPTRASVRASVW
eukprot:gene7936-biopygen1547